MTGSRRAHDGAPFAEPLPNYGRGALAGLAGTIIAAVIWAAYQLTTDSYGMLMPVGAGWFASACVKWGMGSVDRMGIALSIYFTALIVFLGEFFFFAWRFVSATGRLSLGGPFGGLVAYYRADIKGLFLIILFTGLGFVVAVINCRESRKKVNKTGVSSEDDR